MNGIHLILVFLIPSGLLFLDGYAAGEACGHENLIRAFPIRGIDISHHQGKVNWGRLRKQGISFVYMKATEGGNFKDPAFSENWNQAKTAKIKRGAYHYFTFCREGSEQAKNFIETVPLDPDALPPAVDFEFLGNCRSRPVKEVLVKELFDCLKIIEKRYQKKPVLYLTYESYETYLKGEIRDYRIWIRDYDSRPLFPSKRKWSLWQVTNKGKINGIKGLVDINVFNGTASGFIRFIHSKF